MAGGASVAIPTGRAQAKREKRRWAKPPVLADATIVAPRLLLAGGSVQEVLIPSRFNGPPASGNGGYSAGVVASFVDGDASVRLHAPPPLDTPLRVSMIDERVDVHDGDTLVATAQPELLEMEIPTAPDIDSARAAQSGFPGFEGHLYPTCFVCGTGRPDRDGMELYAGPLPGGTIYACSWSPREDFLDADGNVAPLFVWSALDCPGGYGAFGNRKVPMLLGELALSMRQPVPGDSELVVYAWSRGSEGRKYYGGAAIASADGEVLAASRSTWIELKR